VEQNRVSLVNFGLKLVGMRWKLCVFGGENVIFALMNHVVSPPLILAFLPLSLGWFMPRYPSSSSCSCNDGACKIVAFPFMVVSLGGLGVPPICNCGQVAVLRTNKIANNGCKKFWGCPNYKVRFMEFVFSFKVYPTTRLCFVVVALKNREEVKIWWGAIIWNVA